MLFIHDFSEQLLNHLFVALNGPLESRLVELSALPVHEVFKPGSEVFSVVELVREDVRLELFHKLHQYVVVFVNLQSEGRCLDARALT